MENATIEYTISFKWWVMPYIHIQVFTTQFIQAFLDAEYEPDIDRIERVISSGLVVK